MAETCGAKTRSGEPCQSRPMPNGRCRMHGGATPETNQNARTHGIYAKHLTPEERADLDSLKRGTVDDELDLMRIRLARALAAEAHADGEPEIDEVTENEGGGVAVTVPKTVRRSKVRDYSKVIDTIAARIESLEKTRASLIEAAGEPPEGMEADGLTRGAPDEDGPPNPIR
ncbi:HGGxSTG domain-containing protein [Variovorax sp. GB1P17]|uniref:HGGxSTG domain-containing protein n=1 Tax=Variovorax sp. GB1P17 TaxID=3443740 RepID=UPI003F44FB05